MDEITKDRQHLPIFQYKNELIQLINSNQILVCVGETGSGKTTQIPQYLYETNQYSGIIGVTQPRRVAAIAIAQRVSIELGCKLGDTVGYTVRFDDNTSRNTRIKYLTDGCLMRECLIDTTLSKYSVIMLDEAHERSIDTDILFGLLKTIVNKRKDIKLIITSATLSIDLFTSYYNCASYVIPGRLFPVDIFFNKNKSINSKSSIWKDGIQMIINIHKQEDPGHILFFLTGQFEIEKACQELNHYIKEHPSFNIPMKCKVYPLYGSLPTDIQQQIFEKVNIKSVRKVVIATNIADTSITVPDIRYIIDSGYVKLKEYHSQSGIEFLNITRISQTNAQQRAGRAGRTQPGKCYRLYTSEVYDMFEKETLPEIKRSNLANVVLYLKIIGIQDILSFNYLEPPSKESLIDALKLLYSLSALDIDGNVTDIGKEMSLYPLDPCLSKCLVQSFKYGCTKEILTIISMLSVENIFYYDKDDNMNFNDKIKKQKELLSRTGDHFSLLNIYNKYMKSRDQRTFCDEYFIHNRAMKMAVKIRHQLTEEISKNHKQIHSCHKDKDIILSCLCEGFFINISKRGLNNIYKTIIDITSEVPRISHIHPNSSLEFHNIYPDYVLYYQLISTTKNYIVQCTSIKEETFSRYINKSTKIDINRLSGHNINIDFYSIGRTPLLDETIENKTLPSSLSQNDINEAKKRYLERMEGNKNKKRKINKPKKT